MWKIVVITAERVSDVVPGPLVPHTWTGGGLPTGLIIFSLIAHIPHGQEFF